MANLKSCIQIVAIVWYLQIRFIIKYSNTSNRVQDSLNLWYRTLKRWPPRVRDFLLSCLVELLPKALYQTENYYSPGLGWCNKVNGRDHLINWLLSSYDSQIRQGRLRMLSNLFSQIIIETSKLVSVRL